MIMRFQPLALMAAAHEIPTAVSQRVCVGGGGSAHVLMACEVAANTEGGMAK